MKAAFQINIVVDMPDPARYGYSEPTVQSLAEMINRGKCEVEFLYLSLPFCFIVKQKKLNT